jgi:hypothetical protein
VWSRVLFEELIITPPVKKFPEFYFIIVLKELATGPYPEENESAHTL